MQLGKGSLGAINYFTNAYYFFLISGKSFNKGKEVRGGEILNNFSLMKQFEWYKRLF